MTIEAPASLPEALQYVAYAAGCVVAVVAVFWRVFRWLLDRIDERFKAAIRSEEFEHVVDKRVSAAFAGATEPLMAGQRMLSRELGAVEGMAKAAHRRLDAIGAPRTVTEASE